MEGRSDIDADLGALPHDALIRSRAPLRVSFCGGGTDLMPYAADHGGLVLSATISRRAYATLRVLDEPGVQVRSLDYAMIEHYSMDKPLLYDGKFDLIKACLRRLHVPPDGGRGLELYLETDAPPGSGLGASSALVVAVIGAFAAWRGLQMGSYQIAEVAYRLEREDVGIAGGMQDQYAATFGGFNLIEFHGEHDVVVNPLRIEPAIIGELEYNSLLVFTGGTRLSSRIIDSQVAGYRERKKEVIEALHRLKALAIDAKSALLRGRLAELGEILDEQWRFKKATSHAISNARIDALYAAAREAGALGGKMVGAGGGGFMFLVCPFDRRPTIADRLTEMGASVGPIKFESAGLETWQGGRMAMNTRAVAPR